MDCPKVRELLITRRDAPALAALGEHLEACQACAAFARRLELAREVLSRRAGSASRGRHEDFTPDPAFSARVMARLPRRTPASAADLPDLIGWAALRTLPAAVVLMILLVGLGAGLGLLRAPATSSALFDLPSARQLLDETPAGWSGEEPSSSQLLAWSIQPPEPQ